MEQLDPHTCPLCYGDLSRMSYAADAASCDDCGRVYEVEGDGDGDEDSMHYTWGRAGDTGQEPYRPSLFEVQSYVPDARAAG